MSITTKNYREVSDRYVDDVLSGKIISGKWTRLACERQRNDLLRQDTENFPYVYDASIGAKACRFGVAMSPRPAHPDTLASIDKFARCELALEDLCRIVRDVVGPDLRHNEKLPWVNLNSVCPVPAIRITRQHVDNAAAKRRQKQVSERQLVNWATMLMINDVFFWSGEDAELVGEWLERISMDLIPKD
jgi:hypothetical protein